MGGGNVSGEVKVFESRDELSFQLGEWVRKTADAAIEERGKFSLALGGQNIARLLFRELEKPNSMLYYQSVDWDKWHVFWPAEKKSTDTVLELSLLEFKKVFCKTEAESAIAAATDYEYKLKPRPEPEKVAPPSCPVLSHLYNPTRYIPGRVRRFQSELKLHYQVMLEYDSSLQKNQSFLIVADFKYASCKKHVSSPEMDGMTHDCVTHLSMMASLGCHPLLKTHIAHRNHMWGGNEMGNAQDAYFWGGYQGSASNQNINAPLEPDNGPNNGNGDDNGEDPDDEIVLPVMDENGKIFCVHCFETKNRVKRLYPNGLKKHTKDVHYSGRNVTLNFCDLGCMNYFPVGDIFEGHQARYNHRG